MHSMVAARAGLTPSALRFYEAEGLIAASRTGRNQRRFDRDVLRRIAVVRIAQRVGLTIEEIRAALATLPDSLTPTKADWERLSRAWRGLDEQIAVLERLRDKSRRASAAGASRSGPVPSTTRRTPPRVSGPAHGTSLAIRHTFPL